MPFLILTTNSMNISYINKAEKFLSKLDYFCYFKDNNVLMVSEDKALLPFMSVISDDRFPASLIMSIAVDYPKSSSCCQIVLNLNKFVDIRLTEEFYVAKNGNTYFGEEAHKFYDYDIQAPLEELEPTCEFRH